MIEGMDMIPPAEVVAGHELLKRLRAERDAVRTGNQALIALRARERQIAEDAYDEIRPQLPEHIRNAMDDAIACDGRGP
jgi:hypothetical protein